MSIPNLPVGPITRIEVNVVIFSFGFSTGLTKLSIMLSKRCDIGTHKRVFDEFAIIC